MLCLGIRKRAWFIFLMPLTPFLIVLLSTFMHAGWNLLARRERGRDIFMPLLLMVGGVGLLPALLTEGQGHPILPLVGFHLLVTSFFQATYYLGLFKGYRSGDFTVVYPVARSLPVLVLALVDVARGDPPSPVGWLGMGLIIIGCVLAPLESWRGFTVARYWNKTMIWIGVTAAGMVGYTLVDRAAAALLHPGVDSALRYGLWEAIGSAGAYFLLLKLLRQPTIQIEGKAAWGRVAIAGAFMFGAYSLVLWAYQMPVPVSYIVALRQFSIVLGVILGTILFREPAPRWRISMALLIVAGVLLISVWG